MVDLASGEPVMVMVEVPAGVLALVLMVRVLEQVGLQGLLVKVAVAPAGRPEAARVTGWEVPLSHVLVIVALPAAPWTTPILLLAARL